MFTRACCGFSLLALMTGATALAQAPAIEPLADAVADEVLAWRRDIHQFPELGNREFETSRKVAEHLRALGIETRTGIAHTGVVGLLNGGKPGPRIALRADMDALPVTERTGLPFASTVTTEYNGSTVGVMHACGHDTHVAILMGVAQALAGMRDELPGEVMFIFQPAEEGPPEGEEGGAELMLKEGLFVDFKPDAVFGLHVIAGLPVGKIGYRGGPTMAAADSFRIVVKGRQTHGSQPWGGIDPIVAAADIVSTAQTLVSRRTDISTLPAVLSFGAINGGVRSNIIPDEVELIGTIRTFDSAVRTRIQDQLRDLATHVAAAHGATVEAQIPSEAGYPVTRNDEALTARMRPSLERAAGAGNVLAMPLILGSEDFSFFANEVPGLFFFVGATSTDQDPRKAPTNHSPEFVVDEAALPLGTRAMLAVALDFLHAQP
ncbi:amidohydrolase [uncultured Aquimonas sp.]|uniref:amidohydrolase n=1 Tax=uncultured Aquimonas sp. TaxID=385483 RepID=UPI00086C316F|nr:amidohydrolase [uncultured Aquimonas sp.]ODU41045.1 MAG: N-acyl-L-amino acid amidohydrolase [Xanthomonadaceae bacterium SCN 69-123]